MTLSGTRGIIGENFVPTVAMEMAMAYGTWLGSGPIIIGTDSRTSRDMLKSAVISGLTAVGVDVIDIGIVPTPTVQQMIRHHNASGGIVVTASHNPVIWNGLKLMNGSGSFLDEAEYAEYNQIFTEKTFNLVSWDKIGTVSHDSEAIDRHIDVIFSKLDPTAIQSSGLKVMKET